ncbi:MAG TPA: GNAT family N-acetyltransferase [Thermoanaerobaculia bacterium]|nr:GNAT family N-acetyltransferase [Thermoanaerobaculia bacterium]
MDGLLIPTLETTRLRLRELRGGDFEDYAALYADPEVTRFLGTGETWDRGRAWRHMAFAIGHWQLEGTGVWVAEERATGAFVGMIGFSEPATWPGFELSGHLARRAWGRGYASEGARAAMAYAFEVLGRERLMSLVNPANHASIQVAERIGEKLEGRIEFLGRQFLLYGLNRDRYFREIAPAARRAG